AVVSTSPQKPSSRGWPGSTRSALPAGAVATATWMARLSPSAQRTQYAGAASRAPDHAGLMRGAIARAPLSPTVAAPSASSWATRSASATPVVDGDLDGAGVPLGCDGVERVAPALERERVGQHAAEVDAAATDQIEVVLDAVLAEALDLLDAEGVGADPVDLLEVQRAPLPPAGSVHAALHERAPRLEQADADLERLWLAHRVVHDVDARGMGHRQAHERLAQPPAGPR